MINVFNKLKTAYQVENGNILAESYPNFDNHKIGIDSSLQPIILIHAISKQEYNVPSRKLELIDIFFNQLCVVNDMNSGSSESRYTILKLKSDHPDLQQYFLNICALFLTILGNTPNVKKVHKEVLKVVDMFSSLSSPPKKSIQGLFAELLIINESLNCDKLIEAWHPIQFDIDDFNDGISNLEVKSTTNTKRVHSFSHDQLVNKNDLSCVASILIKFSGKGINLLELLGIIENRVVELKNRVKLNQIFLSIVGDNYNHLSDIFFDYRYSFESIKFYKTNEIDHIDPSAISSEISNIKYSVDLSSNSENTSVEKKGFFQFLK
jgi:hypothetical protein